VAKAAAPLNARKTWAGEYLVTTASGEISMQSTVFVPWKYFHF
jgi:hypothetical protein